jgi:hypothetical protein
MTLIRARGIRGPCPVYAKNILLRPKIALAPKAITIFKAFKNSTLWRLLPLLLSPARLMLRLGQNSDSLKLQQREEVMKTTSGKAAAGKLASWAIVAVVVAGALAVSGVADVSGSAGPMGKVFILFIGAVIALQVIPGLMLLGAMFKGIYSMFSKKVEADASK